jgi:uncharacterized membrane protein
VREARAKPGIGNRLAPKRFLLFVALFAAGIAGLRMAFPLAGWAETVAMAFDAAAIVFLVSLAPLLRDSNEAAIRAHAADNDSNRLVILLVTTSLTVIVMAALVAEMEGARTGDALALAKLAATLLLIWLFANSIYALHYAHAYYTQDGGKGGDAGGLEFPGTDTPSYGDFAYFSFTLAMTFQTSDVAITSRPIRRIALLHCFAAFVFNIGVIAFTISMLGGR